MYIYVYSFPEHLLQLWMLKFRAANVYAASDHHRHGLYPLKICRRRQYVKKLRRTIIVSANRIVRYHFPGRFCPQHTPNDVVRPLPWNLKANSFADLEGKDVRARSSASTAVSRQITLFYTFFGKFGNRIYLPCSKSTSRDNEFQATPPYVSRVRQKT